MLRAALGFLMVVMCMTVSASVPLAGHPQGAAGTQDANPLLTPSTLPFQAIPWDKVKDAHFRPALEEGMRQQLVEINAIADNTAAPTFENTLVALEKSGLTLMRAQLAMNVLTGANTNDDLQKLDEEMAPKISVHQDTILLNSKLFNRIET